MCTHFLKIVNLIIVQGVKAAVKTCKPISLYLNAMRLPLPPGNEDKSYTNTSHFQHCGSILPNDQVLHSLARLFRTLVLRTSQPRSLYSTVSIYSICIMQYIQYLYHTMYVSHSILPTDMYTHSICMHTVSFQQICIHTVSFLPIFSLYVQYLYHTMPVSHNICITQYLYHTMPVSHNACITQYLYHTVSSLLICIHTISVCHSILQDCVHSILCIPIAGYTVFPLTRMHNNCMLCMLILIAV